MKRLICCLCVGLVAVGLTGCAPKPAAPPPGAATLPDPTKPPPDMAALQQRSGARPASPASH